jgi:peroxin-11C
VDFLSSLSGLLYYPTEHLAWATDLKILPFKSSSTLWNFCTVLWITSLVSSCVRSLFTLWQTGQEIKSLSNEQQLSSEIDVTQAQVSTFTAPKPRCGSDGGSGRKRGTFQERSSPNQNSATRLRVLRSLYTRAAVGVVQSLSDLVMAVHFLPRGVLWGGRLSTVLVGLFGTLSSLIGLYKILPHTSTRTV